MKTKICVDCGQPIVEFNKVPYRKYSKRCIYCHRAYIREENKYYSKYNGKDITKTCPMCLKGFRVKPLSHKRICCGNICTKKRKALNEKLRREDAIK